MGDGTESVVKGGFARFKGGHGCEVALAVGLEYTFDIISKLSEMIPVESSDKTRRHWFSESVLAGNTISQSEARTKGPEAIHED